MTPAIAPWWDSQTAIWIGAAGGGGLGTLGGLLGATAGLLVPRNKGRAFVVGSLFTMGFLGLAALAAGVVALLTSQPFYVWFPLLLGGKILAIVGLPLAFLTRRLYNAADQRALAAREFRQG